ncbi:hypothetical protein GHT06_010456 [Daphnia sinensis]|uniref:Uncharacterized protein n=1 Tax=Daphnia sinensis TaxID=1820382 RepID=A0AAD5LJ63_9CRUS|nr:hypothetical protein GHT06_010456 [Daphnia sinensis]
MDRVEELKNNMVHLNANLTANGIVVSYNFSEEFVGPKEIESGRLRQWCIINGRDWIGWHYSPPEHTDPHHPTDVGNNSINGVAVEDTSWKNASHIVIQGTASFSAIEGTVGEIDSTEKRERAFHRISADRRSYTGFVNFTGLLLVDDAKVDSLNDLLIKDLLSTSGKQIILASIEVNVLDVQGNIDCQDINGRNVDDFLYSNEDDTHIVLGRHRSHDLVMENGSFNSVDIITLLDSPSLLLDKINRPFDRSTAFEEYFSEVVRRKLFDFVQIAGTTDVQSITGPMDIQHVTVENSLQLDDHVLNGRNLAEYHNVTKSHFDSLSVPNGFLLLDQPSENNPDFAISHSGTLFLYVYLVTCAIRTAALW